MTNLERAKNGERLKVRKSGDYIIRSIDGEDFFVNPDYVDDLINWINQQIDIAVTNAIAETEDPELWRDLKEGEVYQEGDRILMDKKHWVTILENHFYIGMKRTSRDNLVQRRVRREEL